MQEPRYMFSDSILISKMQHYKNKWQISVVPATTVMSICWKNFVLKALTLHKKHWKPPFRMLSLPGLISPGTYLTKAIFPI